MLLPHPDIEIAVETHFVPTLYDEFGDREVTFDEYVSVVDEHYDSSGRKWIDALLENNGKNYRSFPESFRKQCDLETGTASALTDELYRFLFGRVPACIGDKTPHYGTTMDVITDFWPNAKFIHIVRDGVYAADSMTRHAGFQKQIGAGTSIHNLDRQSYHGEISALPVESISIDDAINFWEKTVIETRAQGQSLPEHQYMEIRYEDLLMNPEASLREVASFLGVTTTSSWLNRGAALPYPFYIHRMERRVDDPKYRRAAALVSDTMDAFDYPITDFAYESTTKELTRSLWYYWYNLPDTDYWRKLIGRRLNNSNIGIRSFFQFQREEVKYMASFLYRLSPIYPTGHLELYLGPAKLNSNQQFFRDRVTEFCDFFDVGMFELLRLIASNGVPNGPRYWKNVTQLYEDSSNDAELKNIYEETAALWSLRFLVRFEREWDLGQVVTTLREESERRDRPLRVIDYGCGISDLGLAAAVEGHDVTICDLDDEKFEFAQWRYERNGYDVDVVPVEDVTEFPDLGEGTYDIVFASEVMKQVTDPVKLLKVFRRALDNDGLLYCTQGTPKSDWFGNKTGGTRVGVEKGNSEEYRQRFLGWFNNWQDTDDWWRAVGEHGE
jgi:SAM-dependent methyltransferase